MARKENFQTEEEPQRSKKEEKKLAKEEKKRLKKEKGSVRGVSSDEIDEDEGNPVSVVFMTILIILIWLFFLGLMIKMDVFGFGSGVLRPVLKNVPVVNKILPTPKNAEGEEDPYYGYDSMEEAVNRIKELELELQDAQTVKNDETGAVEEMQAEIKRLKTFEDSQVEFEKIKNEFYNEVIYAENAPDIEEYKKYYEEIDPTNAEILYKQVVEEVQYSKEVEEYAAAYSAMKPKQAALIFEAMTDNLELAAQILDLMSSDDRGKILGAMNSDIAAKLTKIMDPEEK